MSIRTAAATTALLAAIPLARAQDAVRTPHPQDVEAAWWLELRGPTTAEHRTAPHPGVLIRADGQEARITPNATPAPFPAWSPDRRHRIEVVYDRQRRERDLWIEPVRVSVVVPERTLNEPRREVRLTHDHDDHDPFWSKDGSSIFFRSDRGGDGWQLWRIAADGSGEPERLTAGDAKVHDAHLAPDGRNVLLVRATPRPPAQRQGMRTRDLDVSILDLDTEAVRTLVGDVFTADAAWSPDGTKVVCGVDSTVKVFDAATGGLLRSWESDEIHESAHAHGAHDFLWRPDNAAIACKLTFLGQTAVLQGGEPPKMFGDDEVFVLGLDGSATTLAPPADDELRAAWTGRPIAWRRLPR